MKDKWGRGEGGCGGGEVYISVQAINNKCFTFMIMTVICNYKHRYDESDFFLIYTILETGKIKIFYGHYSNVSVN